MTEKKGGIRRTLTEGRVSVQRGKVTAGRVTSQGGGPQAPKPTPFKPTSKK